MTLRPQHTYVLRVWLEPSPGAAGWRASVSDVGGLEPPERRYFHDFDALVAFLKEQLPGPLEAGPPVSPETGEASPET